MTGQNETAARQNAADNVAAPPGLTQAAKPELTPMAAMSMEFRAALIELLQTELPMKKVRGYVETLEQLPIANVQITKDGQPPKP